MYHDKIIDEDPEEVPTEPEEPEEGDIILSDCGPLGSLTLATCYGKVIAGPGPDAECREAVKDWMDNEEFFPSVWYVSDHGNYHLVTTL